MEQCPALGARPEGERIRVARSEEVLAQRGISVIEGASATLADRLRPSLAAESIGRPGLTEPSYGGLCPRGQAGGGREPFLVGVLMASLPGSDSRGGERRPSMASGASMPCRDAAAGLAGVERHAHAWKRCAPRGGPSPSLGAVRRLTWEAKRPAFGPQRANPPKGASAVPVLPLPNMFDRETVDALCLRTATYGFGLVSELDATS